jgi:ribonuclease D
MLLPQQQAALQALFIFRDECARRFDRPPFKVINNHTLVQLAQAQPKTLADLKAFKGVGNFFVKRCGPRALNIFYTAPPAPLRHTTRHTNNKTSETTFKRYEYLRRWRNTLAQNRGVEPDVILSNDVLLRVAKANPATVSELKQLNILGQWQFNTYAEALIDMLKKQS